MRRTSQESNIIIYIEIQLKFWHATMLLQIVEKCSKIMSFGRKKYFFSQESVFKRFCKDFSTKTLSVRNLYIFEHLRCFCGFQAYMFCVWSVFVDQDWFQTFESSMKKVVLSQESVFKTFCRHFYNNKNSVRNLSIFQYFLCFLQLWAF